MAGRGTGSTAVSGCTWHFHPWGKCRVFLRKRFTSTGLSGCTWHFHPWGKCREFPRKRFTFPRGRQGYRLHRPLWLHLAFPPLGKVPGISAKTVHFPPRPTGALAPQASLAALGISTPGGESAGNSCENGSLSPVAGRGTGSTDLSGSTHRFHLPAANKGTGSTGLSGCTWHFHPWGKCREFPRKRFTFPHGMRLQGMSSRACLGKCLVYRHSEKEHQLDLG